MNATPNPEIKMNENQNQKEGGQYQQVTLVGRWLYRYPRFKEITFDLSDPSTYPLRINDPRYALEINERIPLLLGHEEYPDLTPFEAYLERMRYRSQILWTLERYINSTEDKLRRKKIMRNSDIKVKTPDRYTPEFRQLMLAAVLEAKERKLSISQIAHTMHIDPTDVRIWNRLYSDFGKDFINFKVEYDEEERLMIAKEYLTTDQSFVYTCSKYIIHRRSQLRNWILKYKANFPFAKFKMPSKGGPEYYGPYVYDKLDPRERMVRLPPLKG